MPIVKIDASPEEMEAIQARQSQTKVMAKEILRKRLGVNGHVPAYPQRQMLGQRLDLGQRLMEKML